MRETEEKGDAKGISRLSIEDRDGYFYDIHNRGGHFYDIRESRKSAD